MSSNSSTAGGLERYPRVLRGLHWTIAMIVLAQLTIALTLTQLRSLEFGQWVLSAHRQMGFLVLLLICARLALWRMVRSPRTPIPGLPGWQRGVASGVHVMFMILLIVQPVIGVFSSWARGDTIGLLGLVHIDAPFDISDDHRDQLMQAHIIVASLLFGLILMHVGAVAFNRLARGVSVIERMLAPPPTEKLVNRTPIGVQLALGFGVLIAFILFSGSYSIYQYVQVTHRTAVFRAGAVAAAEHTHAAQTAWKEICGIVGTHGAAAPEAHLAELAQKAQHSLSEALTHAKPGEPHDALGALLTKAAAITPAGAGWRAEDVQAFDQQLQDVVDSQSSALFQERSELEEQTARGHDLMLIALEPTLLIGLVVGVWLSRSITGSLDRMRLLVQSVTANQSCGQLQVVGNGEFSTLLRDMLDMRTAVEQRGRQLLELRAAAAQADAEAAAERHRFDAERMRLAEEQKSREAAADERDRASRRAQRQRLTAEFESRVAGIVSAVADTIRDLKETAGGLAASAGTTSQSSHEASQVARRTSDTAASIGPAAIQLSDAANGFRDHAENSKAQALRVIEDAADARTQIESLVGAARQIGTIADEITEIARGTSLLAINARIQAALAGEDGKGFAVVATEVKDLASKTRNAVDGIGSQIDHVTAVANQSSEFLQRVLARIEMLESAATGICKSADAQCATTADIAERIGRISESTQAVARNIDAAQSTANETEDMAGTVLQMAERMAEQARQLQEQVAHFVLEMQGDSGGAPPSASPGLLQQNPAFLVARAG